MATATTLSFMLIMVATVKVRPSTSDTSGAAADVTTTDINTSLATQMTSQPPCPELDGVYSERGGQEVNICWTMKDNWNESEAKYEIRFRLQNESTVVIEHDHDEDTDYDHCQLVSYEAIALDLDQTIEYKVTVAWRGCHTYKNDSTTRRAPYPPRADPLTRNETQAANLAIATAVISVVLVLAVLVVNRIRKRSREL